MKIAVLGSTGSIGTSTLDVVRQYPDLYQVVGLSAGANTGLLADQVAEFSPRYVSMADHDGAAELRQRLDGADVAIGNGEGGAVEAATLPEADMVVAAIAGSAGLAPTLAAVQAGKDVALANKESLVMAGALMTREAERSGGSIVPVDSEHSAIFQLLRGHEPREIRKIILTASGGPFLYHTAEQLDHVTPEEALNHPRWKMGKKVTTDSASLMNKGLEILEAHWLFGLPAERIEVVVHPQSIIHSMVEFVDGTVFAQMSEPDMKGPIAYALSCPERLADITTPLDFARLAELTFLAPDLERFPALRLAYEAMRAGGLMPAVMNAANEVAVEQFHELKIGFTAMSRLIETVMSRFRNTDDTDLESVMAADLWARREAAAVIEELKNNS